MPPLFLSPFRLALPATRLVDGETRSIFGDGGSSARGGGSDGGSGPSGGGGVALLESCASPPAGARVARPPPPAPPPPPPPAVACRSPTGLPTMVGAGQRRAGAVSWRRLAPLLAVYRVGGRSLTHARG